MARSPREHRLETAAARDKLKARSEPYWRQIVPGTFIGYRKGKRASAWIARQRVGDAYAEQRIGTPDDQASADGDVVLTYRQAVERAQRIEIEARTPAPRHYRDGITLGRVVEDYLETRQLVPGGRQGRVMAPHVAASTLAQWKANAEGITDKPVGSLDANVLKRWHASIARKATTNRGKVMPFDPTDPDQVRARRSTANRVLTVAKAALTMARKAGSLPDDMPDWWRLVEPFNLGDDPIPRMMDTDEVRRLLNAAEPDLRELLTGALLTGARYGELIVMKVRDFDPESGRVRIYQGKTNKTLSQPLTAEGRQFFDSLTAGRDPAAPMFLRADGNAWAKGQATKPMKATAERAGLEDVSFKVTRATYGKLLLIATKDLELVAKALGHSDSRITRKHYAALLPSELERGLSLMPSLGIGAAKVTPIRKKSGTRR